MEKSQRDGGAEWSEDGTTFVAFTTTANEVSVRTLDDGERPERTERLRPTEPAARWEGRLPKVRAGALYELMLDGTAVPDPYARFLPRGVHGPGAVIPPAKAEPLATPPKHWVFYELHVGTFTQAGTYAAAIERLDHVASLGVTAIELLPLASYDGHHGWGYDGVALFAPHAPYGQPNELRTFIAEAHKRGLAVILDAVYNHFGPSGNYLSKYAPQYFSENVHTPWGAGPDFTWPPMRRLVLDNVRYWLDEFGFDGLRLDATHTIQDASPKHILTEIAEIVHQRGRVVFFEDERDEKMVLKAHHPDGVWADALHHYLHVALTGEKAGYYSKYQGGMPALVKLINEIPDDKSFVTCIQNHDQIGNRAMGDRLSALVSPDAYLAALAVLLFVPGSPLLFMGQEWAASSPFLFFSDHKGDLGHAVSEGRRKEFKDFPEFDPPDPQAAETFEKSRLRWDELSKPEHARVLAAHRDLLKLRRELTGPAKAHAEGTMLTVQRGGYTLVVDFDRGGREVTAPSGAQVVFRSPKAVCFAAKRG